MKKIIALLLACMMVLGLAACGTTEPTTTTGGKETTAPKADTTTAPKTEVPKAITLTVWAPAEVQSEEHPWLQTMTENFAKAHPEYEITWKFEPISEADAKSTITTDVTAGANVYMFANDQLGELVDAKALAPITGTILETIMASNGDTMINSVTYKDAVYGVPYTGNTWWMYYDTSVFTAEDITSLEAMLQKGKVAFRLQNGWYTQAFYLANGCSFFGPNSNDAAQGFDFGGDKATAVTNYLVDLVANPNFVADDDQSGLAGIKDGSIKAFVSGDWEAEAVREALGENFGAAQLPSITIDGEAKTLKAFAGSKAIGVNPSVGDSDTLIASYLLAAYLGSAEAQQARYEICGTIPCDASLADALANDPVALAQMSVLNNTSAVQPTIPEMGVWWDNAKALALEIIAGTINHDNAAEKTEAFNTVLNDSISK